MLPRFWYSSSSSSFGSLEGSFVATTLFKRNMNRNSMLNRKKRSVDVAERKEAVENTLPTYNYVQEIAIVELAPTHPIRLRLALNFFVFYYEILNSPDRAYMQDKVGGDKIKEAPKREERYGH
eukprot:Gb_33728 [translate_table: standard]